MAKRALHDILCEVLDNSLSDGKNRCYFEPPANVDMEYPCIVYKHNNDTSVFADNIHYQKFKRYSITVIDVDPDSKIPERLSGVLYCSSDRNFVVDGLHHFVYTLYYNGPRIKEE